MLVSGQVQVLVQVLVPGLGLVWVRVLVPVRVPGLGLGLGLVWVRVLELGRVQGLAWHNRQKSEHLSLELLMKPRKTFAFVFLPLSNEFTQ